MGRVLGQARDQGRILDRADPMIHPLGVGAVERLADGVGPGHLAGMGRAIESAPGRLRVNLGEGAKVEVQLDRGRSLDRRPDVRVRMRA